MKTKEAIDYYGSIKKLANALGIWPQTIYTWGETPPMARQYELEVKTEGALKADRDGLWLAKDRSGKLAAWEAPDLGAIIAKIGGKND